MSDEAKEILSRSLVHQIERLTAERDAMRAKLVTARILLRRVNTEFREVLHTSDRNTPTWRDAWELIDSIDAALKGD